MGGNGLSRRRGDAGDLKPSGSDVRSAVWVEELTGTDVILVHRLLKNSVAEQLASQGYLLLTDACLVAARLAPEPLGLVEHRETYDSLGEVVGWVHDPEAAWRRERELRRVTAPSETACSWWKGDHPGDLRLAPDDYLTIRNVVPDVASWAAMEELVPIDDWVALVSMAQTRRLFIVEGSRRPLQPVDRHRAEDARRSPTAQVRRTPASISSTDRSRRMATCGIWPRSRPRPAASSELD